jgi:phosphoglycolate phosphatase-like HAD superfamily hydrolase
MPKAAILDIDGTLVDTNYHHVYTWSQALRQHGFVVPLWRIHRTVGQGGDQLVKSLIGEQADGEVGDDVRAAEGVLFFQIIFGVQPFDGATELIDVLKERGRTVVLASSAKSTELEHYLDLLDARERVDAWTMKEDVKETKPAPDLVGAALEKAGVEAADAVMVGDTPWDVKAAEPLGVPVVAVLTGGFSEQELREAGAVAVFESIPELLERIEETPLA